MSEQTCSVCGRVSSHGDIGPMFDSVVCYAAIDCETHRRVVRALTAQAWAVACAVQWTWQMGGGDTAGRYEARTSIALLPAPADLAREILGDG